jgi:hypothetical protein
MENVEKKKSRYEYFLVFVLVLILGIFASRIVHILQASFNGCGISCPARGMDSKNVNPVENNKEI